MAKSSSAAALVGAPTVNPPRTTKSVVKRQLILEAAAEVFRRRGYSEATVAEIARSAGTHAGSLYYHFENRDHLVIELLNHSVTRMEERASVALAQLPKRSSARDRLVTLIRSHVLTALELDDFALAHQKIYDQVSDEIKQRMRTAPRRYARKWEQVIAKAVAEGSLRPDVDQRLLRLLIVGAVAWMLDWYKPDGASSPSQIADFVVDLFLRGALNRPQADTPA